MIKRAFFLSALGLAVAAFIIHCVARSFLHEAMQRKTVRISETAKQQTPYVPDPLAIRASYTWKFLTVTGIVITVLSIVCMATAALRREPGKYSVVALLLVFDVGMPMLL